MDTIKNKFRNKLKSAAIGIAMCTSITLSSQSLAATEDEKNLVALSNWALIAYSTLFNNSYDGPFSAADYLATHFIDSNSYLGIKDGQLDALIPSLGDNVISLGPVSTVMMIMSASENGVINMSGNAVDEGRIPATFSPGYGAVTQVMGQIIDIEWQIHLDAGTTQSEVYTLNLTINAANQNTAAMAAYSTTLFAGEDTRSWTSFAFSNAGVDGIQIDHETKTITFSGDIELPPSGGDAGTLIINAINSKLYWRE